MKISNTQDVIQNRGSVDDIRCSLKLMNPETGFEVNNDIEYLNRSLSYETRNLNRVSVIKMLQSKINVLKRFKPGRP